MIALLTPEEVRQRRPRLVSLTSKGLGRRVSLGVRRPGRLARAVETRSRSVNVLAGRSVLLPGSGVAHTTHLWTVRGLAASGQCSRHATSTSATRSGERSTTIRASGLFRQVPELSSLDSARRKCRAFFSRANIAAT